MDHCVCSLCVDHKYCSVIRLPDGLCDCAHPCVTHHRALHTRWTGRPPLCTGVTTCTTLSGASPTSCLPTLTRHQAVLARRDPEGFYYLGVVRHEEEPGVFLVHFNRPPAQTDRCPSVLQKTATRHLIQHHRALSHPILPGDCVLSPCHPEQARYAPGIAILGLETRDPLRVSEDEELTVSFWNGKRARVPLGVAVWISPTVYQKIVEELNHPISSQLRKDRSQSSTYAITDLCTAMATPLCATDHHHCGHHIVHPHCAGCCFPTHHMCSCCQDWWALSPRSTLYVPKQEEAAPPSSGQRESSGSEERHFPSSSGSDGEGSLEDEDTDGDTDLSKTTQSTMVDSGVNTDSSLWEKPLLDTKERPEWKYWKRGQPEPFRRTAGIIKQRREKPSRGSGSAVSGVLGFSNRSALFEAIPDSAANRLSVRDVLQHADFAHSQPSPPIAEHLGQSEVEKLRRRQEALEKQRREKLKHRDWEQKREEESLKKYSERREEHRKKTLQRLQDEELTLREREMKDIANMKAKMAASKEHNVHNLTIAAEDRKREERRLEHLRNVRKKIDQREFQKCAASEQREIQRMAAHRQKVHDHHRHAAQKIFQDEQL